MVTRMGNGSISEAHTGVIPQSRPPKGKPPEPSKRLPRVKAVFNSMGASSEQRDVFRIVPSHLLIAVGQAVPLEGYTVRIAHLLDVPLHDDIAELFIQFDGAQMRSVCSQAMRVLPEPPKGSSTMALLMEELRIG